MGKGQQYGRLQPGMDASFIVSPWVRDYKCERYKVRLL